MEVSSLPRGPSDVISETREGGDLGHDGPVYVLCTVISTFSGSLTEPGLRGKMSSRSTSGLYYNRVVSTCLRGPLLPSQV